MRATASLSAALLLATSSFGASSALAQADIELPHQFQAGDTARANEVNENFEALRDAAQANKDAIEQNGAAIDANTQAISDVEARVSAVEVEVMNAARERANTVVVAKDGGDFTSVSEAVASIEDASEDNPYVVLVFPGVYEETDLVDVPPFVHLRGISRTACVITTERSAIAVSSDASAVQLADGARVSDLTVQNRGVQGIAIGVRVVEVGRDTVISNVTIVAFSLEAGVLVVFAILLIVMLLRPQGLLGKPEAVRL